MAESGVWMWACHVKASGGVFFSFNFGVGGACVGGGLAGPAEMGDAEVVSPGVVEEVFGELGEGGGAVPLRGTASRARRDGAASVELLPAR